ncbi:hypothetical protein MATL_G00084150 [Megalops atlanticus]|uniref:Uncharacterized protein n=1 Tax=Megalops atlanticus TaxID=7932 RepID=A0A9D3Q6X3_MEGAT|nr:hypothetical protein MATL_G00084150 [Megalops atlanticus]
MSQVLEWIFVLLILFHYTYGNIGTPENSEVPLKCVPQRKGSLVLWFRVQERGDNKESAHKSSGDCPQVYHGTLPVREKNEYQQNCIELFLDNLGPSGWWVRTAIHDPHQHHLLLQPDENKTMSPSLQKKAEKPSNSASGQSRQICLTEIR